MAKMRGGNNMQALMGFLIYVGCLALCVYYAMHATTKSGRITAMVFAVFFVIAIIGMSAETYGMVKSGTLFDD
jgi:FtsH-binding integral membrane protein